MPIFPELDDDGNVIPEKKEDVFVDDTPSSRRAVTDIFTDEEELSTLRLLLDSAKRTLSDEKSTTADRNAAQRIIKDFLQLKHGKTEKDAPHVRISVKDVYGKYQDINPNKKPFVAKDPVPQKKQTSIADIKEYTRSLRKKRVLDSQQPTTPA